MKSRYQGYTLIELMITCALIAIISVVAVASYIGQVRSSRRSDAINTIYAIALAEERYRTNNSTYGTLAQAYSGGTTSPGGYYTLAVSGNTATGYTITATAVGDQAKDKEGSTSCTPLTLALSSGTTTLSPSACWPS